MLKRPPAVSRLTLPLSTVHQKDHESSIQTDDSYRALESARSDMITIDPSDESNLAMDEIKRGLQPKQFGKIEEFQRQESLKRAANLDSVVSY